MLRGKLKVFANRSGRQFAEKISNELNKPLSPLKTVDFADGETKIILESEKGSVRGCDTYVIQNCFDPTSNRNVYQNFFELLQTGDAIKRAGANKLTAVMPYHPFSRQDKSTGRESLTARLVADLIETAGFDNIICSDLHAPQIEGFYKNTVIDNFPATYILLEYIKNNFKKDIEKLVVIPPDTGGSKRAEKYASELKARPAQSFKVRSNGRANHIEKLKLAGKVTGYNVLVVDDMIDTAGSIEKLFESLRIKNINNSIICCTHSLLNGSALERIVTTNSDLVTTDSIPRTQEFQKQHKWYHEVSLAPLYAEAIRRLNNNESLSELYNNYKV
jgi:ribose-phosphate pyrophosphokinase